MRILTSQQEKILSLDNYRVEHRVFIEKADGTFQDMTQLEGYDWFQSLSFDADIDTITKQATLEITRDIYYLNSSPFVENSKINVDGNGIYKPIIEQGRRVYIESAVIPINQFPQESDFFEVFRGFVYEIDTSSENISITLYDRSGRLQSFIESENEYGADDGSVLAEDVIQSIFDDKFGVNKFDLYTPTPTGFAINPYQQKKEPLLSAVDNIVKNFGWNLEYRWDNSTNQFRFTLYEPNRSKTIPDHIFESNQYYDVQQLQISLENIRNKITGTFTNADTGERETVTVEDTTSINTYGRFVGDDGNTIYIANFMEITEASTSQIDTTAEMTDLLNTVLEDLKQPKSTLQVTVRYFPFVQVNDLVKLKANNVQFDTDQDLAVISYSHDLRNNETTLTLRGKPAGAYDQWLVRDSRPGVAPTSKFPSAPIISTTTGLETDKAFVSAYIDVTLEYTGQVNVSEVQYKRSTDSEWEKFNTQENTVRINNLIPNINYDIRARGTLINGGIANLNYTSQFGTTTETTPADSQAPTTPTIGEVKSKVRGLTVIMDESQSTGTPRDLDFSRYKVYVSETMGFTPSDSNLVDSGNKTRFEITDLVAGTVYYVKVTSVDFSENESIPSSEFSQQAGAETTSSTLVVAASNSSAKGKAGADYICDGIDDQSEINSALQKMVFDNTQGKIVLLDGKYNITQEIFMRSNITIEGQGEGTVIEVQPGFDDSGAIEVESEATGFAIRDLKIDGNNNGTTNFSALIFFRGGIEPTSNSIIEKITLVNSTGFGIFTNAELDDIKISKCKFLNCDSSGIITNNSTLDSGVIISENNMSGCSTGINVSLGEYSITNNISNNNSSDGVLISDCDGSSVSNNICNYNGDNGIQVDGSDNCSIQNNDCKGNTDQNIRLFESSFNNVQNNNCRSDGISSAGIFIIDGISINSEENLITNNDCYNSGVSDGIADSGTNTNFGAGNRNNDGTFSTIPN